jgi:hypothetical protein
VVIAAEAARTAVVVLVMASIAKTAAHLKRPQPKRRTTAEKRRKTLTLPRV